MSIVVSLTKPTFEEFLAKLSAEAAKAASKQMKNVLCVAKCYRSIIITTLLEENSAVIRIAKAALVICIRKEKQADQLIDAYFQKLQESAHRVRNI